jgi:hypothetical protein
MAIQKLENTFVLASGLTEIRNRAISYFTGEGFTQVITDSISSDTRLNLTFKRGSAWSSFANINPAKWKCEVNIALSPEDEQTRISAKYRVDSSDNATPFSIEYWPKQISELPYILTSADYVPEKIVNVTRKALKSGSSLLLMHLGVAVFAIAATVIITLIIRKYISSNISVTAPIATGLVALTWGIPEYLLNKRRKSKK